MEAGVHNVQGISGVVAMCKIDQGLRFATTDGKPLKLALVDDLGNVAAEGESVSKLVHSLSVDACERLWLGDATLSTIMFDPEEPK